MQKAQQKHSVAYSKDLQKLLSISQLVKERITLNICLIKMWVKEILSSHTGMLSCKRICGMLGWITCLIVALYATSY